VDNLKQVRKENPIDPHFLHGILLQVDRAKDIPFLVPDLIVVKTCVPAFSLPLV
jgi:hypothetical protein